MFPEIKCIIRGKKEDGIYACSKSNTLTKCMDELSLFRVIVIVIVTGKVLKILKEAKNGRSKKSDGSTPRGESKSNKKTRA